MKSLLGSVFSRRGREKLLWLSTKDVDAENIRFDDRKGSGQKETGVAGCKNYSRKKKTKNVLKN